MRLRRRILSKQRRYESIATEMKIFLVFIVAFPLCTFSQTSTPDVSMNATSSIQPSSSTENALANDTASQTVEAESFHVNSSTVMVTGNVSTDVSAAPTVLDNQSSTSLSMTPSPSSLPNSTVATSVDDVSPTLNSSSMELPMTISVNSSTDVATSSVVTEVSSTSLGMESSSRVEVEPSTTPTAAQPVSLYFTMTTVFKHLCSCTSSSPSHSPSPLSLSLSHSLSLYFSLFHPPPSPLLQRRRTQFTLPVLRSHGCIGVLLM